MSRPVVNFGPRADGGVGCLLWPIRLFMLPHMLLCLFLIAKVPASILWALCGRDYDAPVTAVERTTSKRTGEPTYWGRYTLRVGGHTLQEKVDVGETIYRRALDSLARGTPPPTIRVRAITYGGFSYKQHLYAGEAVWGHVAFTVFASLFATGIVGVFFYQFWVCPWREARRFRRDLEHFMAEGGST